MFTLSTSCARNSTTCGGEKSLMSSEEKVSSSATLAYGKLESLQAIGQLWLTHGRFAPTYARNFHELRPGQTGNVWLPNIFKHCLVIKHFTVWTPCLMMFDGVSSCLNSINHSIKQHQTFLLSSSVRLARCIKHFWLAHARCIIADFAMLKLLWYSGWFCGPQLLAFGCLTMFDKTSFNRLARALDKEGPRWWKCESDSKVAQFIIMFHCLGLSFWKDGGHHLMDKLLSTW